MNERRATYIPPVVEYVVSLRDPAPKCAHEPRAYEPPTLTPIGNIHDDPELLERERHRTS